MSSHGLLMRSIVATMQNPGVDFGMKCFHTSIKHFRKTGEIFNRNDRHSGFDQGFRRSASGENFNPERRKAAGKLNNSALIAHADKCAVYFRHAGLLGNRPWR